jgi:hypothetical protein
MEKLPRLPTDSKYRLTASEREVLLVIADDERVWHVHTDSKRLTRKLLRVAERWGIEPTPVGAGFEFDLPLRAIRFAGPRPIRAPASDSQKAALSRGRKAFQKWEFCANPLDGNQGSAPLAARVKLDSGTGSQPHTRPDLSRERGNRDGLSRLPAD